MSLHLRGTAFLVTLSLPSGRFPAFSYIKNSPLFLPLYPGAARFAACALTLEVLSLRNEGPDELQVL